MSRSRSVSPWRVHLPTVDATVFRLALRPVGDGPWGFSRAVAELRRLGAEPVGRFRALGRGRGLPLVASQDLLWAGLSLDLEVVGDASGRPVEAALRLPPWDELVASPTLDEAFVWDLVDVVAAALDVEWGAVGDGAAIDPLGRPTEVQTWAAVLERHVGLLVPPRVEIPVSAAAIVERLWRSDLLVVLR